MNISKGTIYGVTTTTTSILCNIANDVTKIEVKKQLHLKSCS